jgi:hypothetical protein
LDWLNTYYYSFHSDSTITRAMRKDLQTKLDSENDKLQVLFDHGNDYEKKISQHFHKTYPNDIITINSVGRRGTTKAAYKRTINAMMKGIPIIEQAVVFNDNNMTNGTADLIVRSDWINCIFRRPVLTPAMETFRAPKLNGDYHYVVIDIKWTTMTLCADGYSIRNEGRFPAYKGQLAIYTTGIGNIQGFIPRQAYVMAKAWKIDKKGDEREGYNCFDLLGVIDYNKFDYQFIGKTVEAIMWLRNLRTNGSLWNPHCPTIPEMYPNCSNRLDSPWTKIKGQLADELDEITQIWYVGMPHRIQAHSQGIMSWKDPRCTSETLGITGQCKPKTIDAILAMNRSTTDIILPHVIQNDLSEWQTESPVDFFVDFETINGCFESFDIDITNTKTCSDFVFMIGIGYVKNGIWQYEVFVTDDLTMGEEERIFNEFTQCIKQKCDELDPFMEYVPRLFHWSHAELTNLQHVQQRHGSKWNYLETSVVWVDMYSVFTSEPIVVKGALNFRLKTIGKAMYKLGLIDILWEDNEVTDGLAAMMHAVKYYTGDVENTNVSIMDTIVDYNEIDCKVIWAIIKYLRLNHTGIVDMDELAELDELDDTAIS